MHVHLPKPLHGWREFAGEVGIIVVGVLIALGGEQAVEAIHWRSEVGDAREALRTELDHDLGAVAFRQAQQPCVARRIDEVKLWAKSVQTGHPITLTDKIGGASMYSIHSSVWEIVKTGQAAAHMPLADKVGYAQIYDTLQNISNMQQQEGDAWRILAEADGARALTDAELRRVNIAARLALNVSALYAHNLDEISEPLRRLRLKPDRLKDYYPARSERFCRSILPRN